MSIAETQTLSDAEIERLAELGASAVFLAVVTTPLERIDGASRSLAHEKVRNHFSRNPAEPSRSDIPAGGGFVTNLWAGNIFTAFRKGDGTNRTILLHVFSEEQIIADGVTTADEPLDYVQNIVSQ